MSLYWLYETSKAWLRVRYCFILFSKQKVNINRHFRHNIASYWSIFALPTKLKSQLSCCLSLSNMTNETLFHSCIIQCFRKKWLGEKYSDSFKYNTWFVPYLNQSYWTNHSNKYSSKNHERFPQQSVCALVVWKHVLYKDMFSQTAQSPIAFGQYFQHSWKLSNKFECFISCNKPLMWEITCKYCQWTAALFLRLRMTMTLILDDKPVVVTSTFLVTSNTPFRIVHKYLPPPSVKKQLESQGDAS